MFRKELSLAVLADKGIVLPFGVSPRGAKLSYKKQNLEYLHVVQSSLKSVEKKGPKKL